MSRAIIQIGPADNGTRMTLDDFDQAAGREGHSYELSKGVIVVTDVPDLKHLAQLGAMRRQFFAYDLGYPGSIFSIASGSDCKILLHDDQSERHLDLTIYKSPPEGRDELWSRWIPAIAVEIVSPSSRHRDYVEKREEYLRFGIREYWIVNGVAEEMLALRRSGAKWVEKVVRANETYKTRQLPKFELNLATIFEAARNAR